MQQMKVTGSQKETGEEGQRIQ